MCNYCNRIKVWSNLCNWIIPSSAGQYNTEYCGKVHPIHNICLSVVQYSSVQASDHEAAMVTICTVGCCWVPKKGDSNCMLIEVIKRLWATHGRIFRKFCKEAPSIVPVSSLALYSAIKAAIQGGQNNWLGRWMCVSSHAWERTWESDGEGRTWEGIWAEQMDTGLFLFKLGEEIRKMFFHHVQEF